MKQAIIGLFIGISIAILILGILWIRSELKPPIQQSSDIITAEYLYDWYYSDIFPLRVSNKKFMWYSEFIDAVELKYGSEMRKEVNEISNIRRNTSRLEEAKRNIDKIP